ncbi:hypothetical protein CQW23_14490 [Capsicum baccatum]|uniref:Uncharacterized protein n=1 Tax=Capsicum baccatum TaxID=33114 RepID=A0A2G2WJE9_CAPBA|nr:hypothetical protein CQW23_14490 [Capsicum baccatum]
MDSSMCSSAPDPEMWIIQGTLAWRSPSVRTEDGPAAPGKRIEEASDYFMHALLGSGGYNSVGRAPLLQLGCCDYGLDV